MGAGPSQGRQEHRGRTRLTPTLTLTLTPTVALTRSHVQCPTLTLTLTLTLSLTLTLTLPPTLTLTRSHGRCRFPVGSSRRCFATTSWPGGSNPNPKPDPSPHPQPKPNPKPKSSPTSNPNPNLIRLAGRISSVPDAAGARRFLAEPTVAHQQAIVSVALAHYRDAHAMAMPAIGAYLLRLYLL